MSSTQRFGGQYGTWQDLVHLTAAPSVSNHMLTPPFGTTVEIMVSLAGGLTGVDVVVYRAAVVGGTEVYAPAQTTALTGHGSNPTVHILSYVHRFDRIAIALLNASGSGAMKVAYRWTA